MKNIARSYRVGGTPKSDEMLNEEKVVDFLNQPETPAKKPAKPVKKAASGGAMYARGAKVGSASSRADGIAQRGKTRGKMC